MQTRTTLPEHQLNHIRDNYDKKSDLQIAKELGITKGKVYQNRIMLNLPKTRDGILNGVIPKSFLPKPKEGFFCEKEYKKTLLM